MDTKTILLIAAAGGAFWYMRSKQTAANTTASNLATGAASYQLPMATNTPASTSGTNWANTATGIITGATSVFQAGTTAWNDISGAFHSGKSDDDNGGDLWAGPATPVYANS
jgi:hypothetical protein